MFKVFLVDDEEWVIESLKASVKWNLYGFEIVGYALRGAEAFEAIGQLNPDVVFTDIRMPGMNGLELIKNLKDAGNDALLIVISGYAEFAFAQKAMNNGAFGYCLKPFDETEITGFLKKAKSILEEREGPVQTDILDLIEEDDDRAREGLRKALLLSGIDMEADEGLGVAVSIGNNKLKLDRWKSCVVLRIGFSKHAYLYRMSDHHRVLVELQGAAKNGIKGIGFSGGIQQVDRIRDAIHSAEMMAYRYFTTGVRLTVEADGFQEKAPSIKKLEEAIARNDGYHLQKQLDELGTLFANGQLNIKHALIVYNLIQSFSHQSEEEPYEDYVYSYEKLASLFGTALEMLKYLKGLLEVKYNTEQERMLPKAQNRTFKPIFKFVNDHYLDDISLQSISKEFDINANYVSQLFKRELGTTFTEHLTNLRIDYACKLLATTALPLNEISEKSGYDDYFYFSRIFKKVKGITPSSYRDSL